MLHIRLFESKDGFNVHIYHPEDEESCTSFKVTQDKGLYMIAQLNLKQSSIISSKMYYVDLIGK